MRILHNHVCTLTSKPTTCYVFDEFPLLFSLSAEAYDKLFDNLRFQQPEVGVCSFCDKNSIVKNVDGFSNTMWYGDIHICNSCTHRMSDLVEPYEVEHS